MEYLNIGDRTLEYDFCQSMKAKKVIISIKGQKIRVAVPKGLSIEHARVFIEENKEWVLKNFLKQASASANANPGNNYVSGEKLLYRGRNYPLIIEETSRSPLHTMFIGSRIITYVPIGLSQEKQSALAKSSIEKWYRGQAEKLLPEQVDFYSKLLDIPYIKLKIKNQKSRWGSCSNKGNINLNWRIIMAPNQVAAYVIIHELIHLKHMNHSKEFWECVEQCLPDYSKCKKWLKENGNALL